jgi:fructan beta-fructosidase
MLGWMSNWEYAILTPTCGWRGALSLPRELSLAQTQNGIRLVQRSIPELRTLRGKSQHWREVTLAPGTNLFAEFESNPQIERLGFRVRVGKDEATTIGYDAKGQQLFVDRSKSGRSDFKDGFAALHVIPLSPRDGLLRLHIFVDRSSVEVFANDGLVTMTESIFPSAASQGLEIFVEGGPVTIRNLELYWLNPANFVSVAQNPVA